MVAILPECLLLSAFLAQATVAAADSPVTTDLWSLARELRVGFQELSRFVVTGDQVGVEVAAANGADERGSVFRRKWLAVQGAWLHEQGDLESDRAWPR